MGSIFTIDGGSCWQEIYKYFYNRSLSLETHPDLVPKFQTDEDSINQLGLLVRKFEGSPMLLVLDDVWPGSEALVEKFKFYLSDYKILVTSRVAFPGFGTQCVLKPLVYEDAMTLFHHYALLDSNSLNTPDEDIVEQVVKSCKGLPLAIKVIGRSLSHRPYELWQRMVEELSHGHSILDSNIELLTYLQKILDVLEDNTVIKECFMDLGLFPEDQRIPVTVLIDIFAESYGLDDDGIEAMTIINKLESMNLVNVLIARKNTSDTDSYYYNNHFIVVHDLLRELAIYQSAQEQLEGSKRLIIDTKENKNEWGLGEKQQGMISRILSNCFRYCSKQKPPQIHARTLSISIDETCNSHWSHMQPAKVKIREDFLELSIDYCKDMVVLPFGLCNITPLKKLSVTNCHKLLALPLEIGKLVNMKLIRLSSCTDLEGIPNSIGKLSNLRHLDISNCISLLNLPEDFGNLCNLRNLYMTSCSRCELPSSVASLVNLKAVICDEETTASWEGFKAMLPNLQIEVPQVDVNLNWLHLVSS
ncbi:putative disease resistance protein [Glycine soja]|uniref:Putative disease resistance protein n=1 Tax=Glycine soja TaxID=3848 RepID=A0A445KLE1_GLYSO|nr:putative disease resistance protein [Glycine soja]